MPADSAQPIIGATLEPIQRPRFAAVEASEIFMAFPILSGWDLVGKACGQPLAEGFGNALLSRWYYNAKEGNCQKFIYRGIGGNQVCVKMIIILREKKMTAE